MAPLTAAGVGAAYGTAKSGIGIAGVGTYRPDLIMKVCSFLASTRGRADSISA
jgi:hypothetical protein